MTTDDKMIRDVVTRLARRHESGGTVIERAAIVAEGAESQSIVAWIVAHDGRPEFPGSYKPARRAVRRPRGRSDNRRGRTAAVRAAAGRAVLNESQLSALGPSGSPLASR